MLESEVKNKVFVYKLMIRSVFFIYFTKNFQVVIAESSLKAQGVPKVIVLAFCSASDHLIRPLIT